MKIGQQGVYFNGMYTSGNPGIYTSTFTDEDGARFSIDTITLLRMAELVKFDLRKNENLERIYKEMNCENICSHNQTIPH